MGFYKASLLTVSFSTTKLIKMPTNFHSRKVVASSNTKNSSYFICNFGVKWECYVVLLVGQVYKRMVKDSVQITPTALLLFLFTWTWCLFRLINQENVVDTQKSENLSLQRWYVTNITCSGQINLEEYYKKGTILIKKKLFWSQIIFIADIKEVNFMLSNLNKKIWRFSLKLMRQNRLILKNWGRHKIASQ